MNDGRPHQATRQRVPGNLRPGRCIVDPDKQRIAGPGSRRFTKISGVVLPRTCASNGLSTAPSMTMARACWRAFP